MTALERRTNGDVVQPYVDRFKADLVAQLNHLGSHPDELAVMLAPVLALTLATGRHRLNFAERLLVSECAIWGGYLALQAYSQWKDKPAGSVPRLRKVT